LLAFPEGKRTLTPYTLKLKRGMIGYAFTRKMQVQLISAFGAEHAINEFAFKKDFKTCHF